MKYEVKCRHCKRFLANATTSSTMELKCSNSKCKKLDTYRIVFISEYHNHDHNRQHSVSTDKLEVEPNKQSS